MLFAAFFAMLLSALRTSSLSSLPRHRATRRRILQLHQAGERRAHHVVRVRRAERLGQHVLNAAALDHRAHRAAGNQAGAFRRRLQQHAARAERADHLVRNRRALAAAP